MESGPARVEGRIKDKVGRMILEYILGDEVFLKI